MIATAETLITLSEAARIFPARKGRRKSANPSTVWRWIRDGVLLPSGERIRLDALRVGAGWLTSREAIDRFVTRQTEAAIERLENPPDDQIRTPGARRRAAERAEAKLREMGV